MLWWRMMFNALKGRLGIATFGYTDGVPTTLLDPRTGLPASSMPSFASLSAAETALPAASNTDQVVLIPSIHEAGAYGGALFKSNGVVYTPLYMPVYTYAAALALCNTNTAGYTGSKFTISDCNSAVHYFDGTNLVPVNGRCLLSADHVAESFTAVASGAGVVSSYTLVSGNIYDIDFTGNHGLTTAVTLGSNLVVKTTANGWVQGQKLHLTAITDGGVRVRVDAGSGGPYTDKPVICRVADYLLMRQIPIVDLHANSGMDFDLTLSCDPRVGNKSMFLLLDSLTPGTNDYQANGMTTNYGGVFKLGFRNRNSQSSQVATHGSKTSTVAGIQNGGAPVKTTVDLSTAGKYMNLMGQFAATENEKITVESLEVWKVG